MGEERKRKEEEVSEGGRENERRGIWEGRMRNTEERA